MFDRFTDRARRVVVLAQESARHLNHPHIGTEHLLLGLLDEGESVAAVALKEVGLETFHVREKVLELVGAGAKPPEGHIPFTPAAKKVIELALREALQLGNNYVGPEHLLLALAGGQWVAEENLAVAILLTFEVTPREIRQAVLRRVERDAREAPATLAQLYLQVWRRTPEVEPAPMGVWMVFNGDGSMARPFPTEIEALRYAVTMSGSQVELTRWGQDVGRPEKAS